MSRAKSVLGIAVLFALALSAVGVSSASAKGITAYTCVKDANGDRFGAHCLTSGTEKYKHVEIPPTTEKETNQTTITATNANTKEETKASSSATLKGALSGVETEVTCAEVHGEGVLENKTNASKEMYIHAEGKLHYTKCEVKAPAGKGCKVNEETITTEQITGTSEGQQTHEPATGIHTFKIKPAEGTTFAKIKIENCSIGALNNTFPVTGSLNAKTSGATLTATHTDITAQNELKFGGVKAGLEGALTFKGHKTGDEVTNPLTITTEP